MKRSATSSAGLPLPPSRYRKRDGVGRAEGERERQISRLRPPRLNRVSGSRPQRNPSPLASRGPATPVMRAAAASAPTGGRSTSPGAAIAATRPAPASPGAIGYRFSCLSLGAPGERGLHRPARAPASISPLTQHRRGSRGATKPSWAGGRGAETTCNGRRGERGCGLGAPANKSPGVVHPPTPCLASCAFKFRPVPLGLQSPRHSQSHKKNKIRKRPLQDPRRWRWARGRRGGGPRGPARYLPSVHPESQPRPLRRPALSQPGPRPQGPFPGRRRHGLELPPPPPPASGVLRPPPPPNRSNAPSTF